jgi:glutathione S-transferase
VSNNGARVRMVMYYKQLEALVDVVSPVDAYGGLKTPEYLALNPQGKMPMLVVPAGDESQPGGLAPIAWAEADPIARHLIDRYAAQAPSLTGETLAQRTLCNAVTTLRRLHFFVPCAILFPAFPLLHFTSSLFLVF